jgi:hypothetical protein
LIIKATFQNTKPDEATLYFSQDLPYFPTVAANSFDDLFEFSPWRFNHQTELTEYAEKMLQSNQGNFPIENSNSYTLYADFLSDLVVIPGFEGILESQRYQISLGTSVLHQNQAICILLAQLIQTRFYPRARLRFLTRLQTKPAMP